MLRVAVPNKGSLAEPASDMLREAGYRQRHDSKELVVLDAENDTEFFFLRPRDIAIYVGSGRLDVGITGEDLLLDSGASAAPSAQVDQLVRRLQGVIIARQYVLVDYDIRDELLEQAVAVTPGIESPTVSPLHERGWSAVRSMVPRKETNRIMDELWALGARGILVTAITACRL